MVAGTRRAGYVAMGRRELTVNSIAVGRFATASATHGKFEVNVVFLGPMKHDSTVISHAFTRVAAEYFKLFPTTPAGRYMLTFFYADHDDGEAFVSSSAITFANRVAAGGGVLFNNKIAHEFLHYWIGQRIRAADPNGMAWFSEGFAEYVANRTIQRTGLISPEEYLDKLSRHVGAYGYFWYSPLFQNRSLQDAGGDKTANRFGVYDGGAVAALCLDLMIRENSGNRRSLDDLLRLLWERYGAPRQRFTLEDFSVALVEVGGDGMRDFVARYVVGHEVLPYDALLKNVGIRTLAWPLSAEAYLSLDPAASEASTARRSAMLLGMEP
jgi:predicted metalloprotease with PDZ domain